MRIIDFKTELVSSKSLSEHVTPFKTANEEKLQNLMLNLSTYLYDILEGKT